MWVREWFKERLNAGIYRLQDEEHFRRYRHRNIDVSEVLLHINTARKLRFTNPKLLMYSLLSYMSLFENKTLATKRNHDNA